MLRDDLLDRERVDPLWELLGLVERWRQPFNRIRPHPALGHRPPAPETFIPCSA